MRLPNVTGVGIGEKDGKEVILVFVRQKMPESELQSRDIIPKKLNGYETENVGVTNPYALAEVMLKPSNPCF